jgi:hypothetical protein
MIIPEIITPQQQPDSKTCVSTSIAMLLGIPVEQVIAEFHDEYMTDPSTMLRYIESKGLKPIPLYPHEASMGPGKVYLLGVPSLNYQGLLHCVLADFRNQFTVYDPNMGRKDKLYYVNKYEEYCEGNEISFASGYVVDCYFEAEQS